jgi:hypothetical protein
MNVTGWQRRYAPWEDRWPDYTPRAAERGNLSSLSIPLAIDRRP